MNGVLQNVSKLRENQVTNLKLCKDVLHSREYSDSVICDVTINKPGLVFFSIPYSKGWSALIDGENAKVYLANKGYLALAISDLGMHSIRLTYRTPYLRLGLLVSIVSIVLLLVCILIKRTISKFEM